MGRCWMADRCSMVPQPKIFSTDIRRAWQGFWNIYVQDMREHRRNTILGSIPIPSFASHRSLNLRKGNKVISEMGLRVQTDPHLFLDKPFPIFKELFFLRYHEENGTYLGDQIVMPPVFSVSEHSVPNFGTSETFSCYKGTIWGISIPA